MKIKRLYRISRGYWGAWGELGTILLLLISLLGIMLKPMEYELKRTHFEAISRQNP